MKMVKDLRLGRLIAVTFVGIAASFAMRPASAHHPDRENQRVHQRIDLIGPVGNRLPPGHRRRYNRPSKFMGWVAYQIAPASREAMAYHRASHLGYYDGNHPRMETHYFFPKPYEVLPIGARRQREKLAGDGMLEETTTKTND
ncbi:MAG: hypothetical protein AAF664_17800 [Planctomycetota bacterium]